MADRGYDEDLALWCESQARALRMPAVPAPTSDRLGEHHRGDRILGEVAGTRTGEPHRTILVHG